MSRGGNGVDRVNGSILKATSSAGVWLRLKDPPGKDSSRQRVNKDTGKGVSILGRGKSCLGLSRTEVRDLDKDAQPHWLKVS